MYIHCPARQHADSTYPRATTCHQRPLNMAGSNEGMHRAAKVPIYLGNNNYKKVYTQKLANDPKIMFQ